MWLHSSLRELLSYARVSDPLGEWAELASIGNNALQDMPLFVLHVCRLPLRTLLKLALAIGTGKIATHPGSVGVDARVRACRVARAASILG
jgi:hypothetical protein